MTADFTRGPATAPPTIAPAPPTTLLIDTDVAPDDIVAITFLVRAPNVTVAGITISGTGEAHCAGGTQVVLGLLERLGAPAIPVACGRETPLAGAHAFPDGWREAADAGSGLPIVPTTRVAASGTAVALIESLAAANDQLEILTLGPLTNLAAALEADPGLAARLGPIFIMGGALHVPGNIVGPEAPTGNSVAEWNIYVDPHAAQIVIDSGKQPHFVSLDGTNQVPLTSRFGARFANAGSGPATDVVTTLFTANPFMTAGGYYLWDPLAAELAAGYPVGTFSPASIEVEEREGTESGFTRPTTGRDNIAVPERCQPARCRGRAVPGRDPPLTRAPPEPAASRSSYTALTFARGGSNPIQRRFAHAGDVRHPADRRDRSRSTTRCAFPPGAWPSPAARSSSSPRPASASPPPPARRRRQPRTSAQPRPPRARRQPARSPASRIESGAPRALQLGRRLVHADVTVTDKDGQLITLQLDHGKVQSIAGGKLTMTEAGGGTETVSTDDATKVVPRQDRRQARRREGRRRGLRPEPASTAGPRSPSASSWSPRPRAERGSQFASATDGRGLGAPPVAILGSMRRYAPDSPWDLDPTITYLTHGTYGACPRPVLEQQRALVAELEADPIRFLTREFEGRLDAARRGRSRPSSTRTRRASSSSRTPRPAWPRSWNRCGSGRATSS